jgi:predicted DNA-binding antitoxin AbrB/MazE fold protein
MRLGRTIEKRQGAMTITVGAVYENGVLKPDAPLQLQEKAKVRVTIEEPTPAATHHDDPTGWKTAERFIGMWKDAPEGEPIAREHDKHLYK